jgi:hypothetical protein
VVGHPYVTRQGGRGRTREQLPDLSVASRATVPVSVPARLFNRPLACYLERGQEIFGKWWFTLPFSLKYTTELP